jgi:alkanesulfonate monooxygenase
MATTFQNLSGDRLLLNVVTGGEDHEQRAYGDFLGKEERYERCDEFLAIVRALWAGETVDFDGQHLKVEGARLQSLPGTLPEIYFGGSSPAAGTVAAKHADVYLTWGEPPQAVAEKIAWIRGLAQEQGREIRFGIRLHAITRDTSAEAWAEAHRLLDGIDDETIAKVQEGLRRSQSEGQRRMLELNQGSRDDLEIYPNLWAGVGLVRGGAGTALVGSHEEVADRVQEYHELGIDEFVLSGYPHLEESYWFGEGVLPLLEHRGLWKNPVPPPHASRASVPFGSSS